MAKFALLKYSTHNLGDDIQTIALSRLLPHVDYYFDRRDIRELYQQPEKDIKLIINGWQRIQEQYGWPIPKDINCLYISVYFYNRQTVPKEPRYPIGCRDPWTFRLCVRERVPAWISWCTTLSLIRPNVPSEDKIYIVDVFGKGRKYIPEKILSRAEILTHVIYDGCEDQNRRYAIANDLLFRYAKAQLVVTSRLHAMLPCVAMGTPVVFIPPMGWEATWKTRCLSYLHLAWNPDNAPWAKPHPKVTPEIAHCMVAPLCFAVDEFVRS